MCVVASGGWSWPGELLLSLWDTAGVLFLLGKLGRGERQGQESDPGSCPNLGTDSTGSPKGQILLSEVYLVFHFPSLLVIAHTASLILAALLRCDWGASCCLTFQF